MHTKQYTDRQLALLLGVHWNSTGHWRRTGSFPKNPLTRARYCALTGRAPLPGTAGTSLTGERGGR